MRKEETKAKALETLTSCAHDVGRLGLRRPFERSDTLNPKGAGHAAAATFQHLCPLHTL